MPEDQIFDSATRREIPVSPNPNWKNFLKDKKIILIVAVSVLLIVVGLAAIFLRRRPNTTITSNNVILSIKGPVQLTAGNEAEFTIVYRNGENSDLVKVSLELIYPSDFTFKTSTPAFGPGQNSRFDLPPAKPGADGTVTVRGKLAGSTGEDKELKATLHYKFANFNSEFSVNQSFHTAILPPSLTLDISGPIQVINGQNTTFSVNFANVSDQEYDNLGIKLTFPTGFSFAASNPVAAKLNNFWTIAKLPVGATGKVDITGSFTGDINSEQLVVAELGSVVNNGVLTLINASGSFTLTASSLALTQSAKPQDQVNVGQQVQYTLNYANYGSVGMTNVIITVNINGAMVDLSHLQADNAIVTGNTLVWKSATLSSLAAVFPNQTGQINFSVPIKSTFASNLKNQTIKTTATIASDQIQVPIKSADLEIKLASQLNLTVSGQYLSGALPMRVGQSTTFAMTFLLINLSNDLTQTEVIASLPLAASSWSGMIVPDSEKTRLSYDPNSGKIHWKIGDTAAFVGKFTPALTVTFQLIVSPTEPDRGKTVTLLSSIQATALDTFINQNISSQSISKLDTGNLQDDRLNAAGTTVQ